MKGKILILLNAAWNVANFRSGLILALIDEGYEVIAVTPTDDHVERILKLGARHIHIDMDRHGTHPLRDLRLVYDIYRILRSERPDVVLAYTIKPNLYGTIVASTLGIPVINNVAGLGISFSQINWLNVLVRLLYRNALRWSEKVFFQNEDDCALFLKLGLVRIDKTEVLPGSGVDLDKFSSPDRVLSKAASVTRFLLVARLLWEKGIREFVEASRLVRKLYPRTEFCLLGFIDEGSSAGVPRLQLDNWVHEGLVTYLGSTADVRPQLALADCVVLPSYYREGTPRSLLEAAAMGRPIITTDEPGCRSVVEHKVNGFLCKSRDSDDLSRQMIRFIELESHEKSEMGSQSRRKAVVEFDEKIVISAYLRMVNRLVINSY